MKALLMVVAVFALVFAVLGAAASPAKAQVSEMLVKVNDGSLTDHACNSSVWHFVINQLSDPSLAPTSIHVVWDSGDWEDVPLQNVTPGGMAHYATSSNLGTYVESASTYIYASWSGRFNLSHGPCGNTETPTPTNTVTVTETVTVTVTQTETPTETTTVTETPTETVTVTETVTQTATATETITQTPTVTTTGTPNETGTPTVTVTNTPLVDPTPTEPSLGGGRPESAQSTIIWPAVLGLLAIVFWIIKRH